MMKIRSDFCQMKELQTWLTQLEEDGCKVVTVFPYETDLAGLFGNRQVTRVVVVYREKV